MKKRVLALALFCLLPAFAARAETLDDASIRAFYASYAETFKVSDDLVSFMQTRFDDKYTLQENLTRIVDDDPPQASNDTYGKDMEILNSIRGANETRIATAQGNVVNIAYSDDHKYAYVTYTLALSGTTKVEDANGLSSEGSYGDAEGCVGQLMLKNDSITIVKSACNGKITIRK